MWLGAKSGGFKWIWWKKSLKTTKNKKLLRQNWGLQIDHNWDTKYDSHLCYSVVYISGAGIAWITHSAHWGHLRAFQAIPIQKYTQLSTANRDGPPCLICGRFANFNLVSTTYHFMRQLHFLQCTSDTTSRLFSCAIDSFARKEGGWRKSGWRDRRSLTKGTFEM